MANVDQTIDVEVSLINPDQELRKWCIEKVIDGWKTPESVLSTDEVLAEANNYYNWITQGK